MPVLTALEIESLLGPLEGASPCGADLEYDPAFLALEEAGAGKPEQQYGDMIRPAEPPDWPTVEAQAVALAMRVRDLRVAVWLMRSAARSSGLLAGLRGFSLVAGLVERWWAEVHPMLDAADDQDPTARLNALAPLSHPAAVLADLRAATLTGLRGGLTVRQIELGLRRAEPAAGESVPTHDGVLAAVRDAVASNPELAPALRDAERQLDRMVQFIDSHVGAAEGVDFKPLAGLFATLGQAAREAAGTATAAEGAAPAVVGPAGTGNGSGAIATRDDAVRALERVCDWIERNEPSHPAPLLIRRAKRLMSKSFLEIMRDLVPDGVDHVEKLAGIAHE